MSSGKFKDLVVVVTGSSRGIGKAIALGFAKEGAKLIVNYASNMEAAQEVTDLIHDMGSEAVMIRADVSVRKDIKHLFSSAYQTFGRVDILVNNAGINKRGWFEEITDDDWDSIMNTNLKGPFICSQEIFPHMIKNGGGRIINISSVAGQYHGPKTVHYAVSKAGINSLTKVLARYGAEHNILVNAVAPGLILTEQTRDEFESGAANSIIDLTLLKRPGSEGDVVTACLFLADPGQNYTTGQVLAVSGGAYLG